MEIRLNKYIAESGLASRRAADRMIAEGQVTVNGKKVYELGVKVDPSRDKILVDGKPLKSAAQKIYLIFHKPKGVITSLEDPLERPTVADYLDKVPFRVFPVGRLDWDSEGLLLLTNDGELANRIMHPKEEVTKTYLVKISGQPKPEQIAKLLKGVSIIGGKVSAKHIEKIKRQDASDQYDWYKIVITEGKNRQIRQMFEKIGYDVMKLQRIAIGSLRLGNVPRGEVVFLHESSLDLIFKPDLPGDAKPKKPSSSVAGGKKRVNEAQSRKAAGATGAKKKSAPTEDKKPLAKKVFAKKPQGKGKKSSPEVNGKNFFDRLPVAGESRKRK